MEPEEAPRARAPERSKKCECGCDRPESPGVAKRRDATHASRGGRCVGPRDEPTNRDDDDDSDDSPPLPSPHGSSRPSPLRSQTRTSPSRVLLTSVVGGEESKPFSSSRSSPPRPPGPARRQHVTGLGGPHRASTPSHAREELGSAPGSVPGSSSESLFLRGRRRRPSSAGASRGSRCDPRFRSRRRRARVDRTCAYSECPCVRRARAATGATARRRARPRGTPRATSRPPATAGAAPRDAGARPTARRPSPRAR